MNYTITKDPDNQNVNVKATCILNQEIRKKILSEIAIFLKISGYHRVLVDVTESSFNVEEPMIGAMELTSHMKAIGIPPQTKLAFVFSEAEAHRKYFENVATNAGFNIRYFKDKQDASKWLNVT